MDFKKILVPVDFSEEARSALDTADRMAAECGASLTLLHIYQPTEVAVLDFTYVEPPEKISKICEAADDELERWLSELRTPSERLSASVVTGSVANSVIEASADFDLVVMSTHGRTGITHFLLGSIAERVVQAAKCSVLIVKK